MDGELEDSVPEDGVDLAVERVVVVLVEIAGLEDEVEGRLSELGVVRCGAGAARSVKTFKLSGFEEPGGETNAGSEEGGLLVKSGLDVWTDPVGCDG